MFDTPLGKFALGLAALAVVVVLATQVLPGQNEAARLDEDQSSGLTAGNDAVEGALPLGQTFVPAVADFAGIDLAFETLPEKITLQFREWPDGQIILLSVHEKAEGNLPCRTPHQSGRGATCRLEWHKSVTLTPGSKYGMQILEWEPGPRFSIWKSRNDYAQGCLIVAGTEQCSAGDLYFRTYTRESP
ncbi:MAG: hypothetical protein GEU75_11410 [Dehalococcoidia bacterium]|nr:hypothetical protein [Dehalococcoidia bacterium]